MLLACVVVLLTVYKHAQAAFPGKNGKIAFQRGHIPEIYTMNPDGSNQTNITNRAVGDYQPAWSPDGTKMVFTRGWHSEALEIYTMNADGSDPTRLTSEILGGAPAWSPDGTRIAFISQRDGLYHIYAMNTDGSNVTRLTNAPAQDFSPDWQPLPSPYTFSGFFRPVDNPPALNTLKAGRAVPLKFSLGGDEGLDIFAEGYPRSRQISCDTSAPLDDIEQTLSAGHSGLSYDAELDQYTYVWKTRKAWSGTCRKLNMKLDDGSVHRANFKFK